jgi:hypothetical protein
MVDDIKTPAQGGQSVGSVPADNNNEPTFAPPEVIAQDDLSSKASATEEEVIDMAEDAEKEKRAKGNGNLADNKSPKKKSSRLKDAVAEIKLWWSDRTKKQKIIIAVAAAIVVVLLGFGGYKLLHKSKPAPKPAPVAKKEEKKEPPKPTTEASHLTGVQVPPEYNLLPVTGIMIENSPDARPQSGLKDAGVVFEAVAEGGITRFLTLFQEAQPDYVGPVRSVRPYYLEWLEGFDAAVAHVGGSPVGLAKLNSDGVKDLDQFYNGGAYQRIAQRYAPHNVYTSLGSLIALEKSKGWTSSSFTGFARKADKPAATPTAKAIDFAISGPLYNAHYDYDVSTNSYLRSEGGTPHKDERSGQQLKPKVVIALVLPQGIDPDGIHTTYNTLGNGTAFIFQDGTVTQGTWSKASDKEQFRFGDANGSPLALNAGQTWISIVGSPSAVTFTP